MNWWYISISDTLLKFVGSLSYNFLEVNDLDKNHGSRFPGSNISNNKGVTIRDIFSNPAE